MAMIKRTFLFFLLGCLVLPLEAQNTSTQGKEFWVSFMGNGYRTNSTQGEPYIINQVLISGKRDCSGTIMNPNTGWSQQFFVRANSITTIDHLEDQAYVETSYNERVVEKGLCIITTDTVSVFCTNIAPVSFDASYVLPIHALADDYMVQTYDQSTYVGFSYDFEQYFTSAFLIVATEDSTTIDITPTVASVTGLHSPFEEFSIVLNAGEVYQYRSTYSGNHRDLSGTRITARDCKRIAVFNGNTLTAIPDGQSSRDIVFEQAMPLQSWGKQFVVTSSYGRQGDYVKVTSSADDNNIMKNGELLTTLNAGESYIFLLSDSEASCFIESDYPAAVFLFNTSYESSSWDHYGDPSMVWIAPIEQRIDEITFTTFHDAAHADIDHHYVNIIVKTEDIATVYLDGEMISPLLFHRVNGNNNYSYIRQEISHDVHHLSCAHGFNAHVYGFGEAKGYAYLVGSKAVNLNTSLVINDVSLQPEESFQYCVEEPITFTAEVNLQNYHLLWDFGDGTTSTSNPVTHTYHDKRLHNASLSISVDEGGCSGSSSDTTYFYIDVSQQYVVEYDEVCEGSFYSEHGFNNVHINTDTILARLQDNPMHSECQDSLLVYITARPNYHIPLNDSRCWQGQPGVYDAHGFSFVYDQPGTYDRQLNLLTHYGCDSILYLHLIVDDEITHEFSDHTCEDSYVWDGRIYTSSGDYEYEYTTLGGCDSIVTLHLTMGQQKDTSFYAFACDTLVWNDHYYTSTGNYYQHFLTPEGCDSIATMHLTIERTIDTTIIVNHGICDQYLWGDTLLTENGIHTKSFTSALGCDSIIHLDLTLHYSPKPAKIRCTDPNAVVYGMPNAEADTIAVVTNTEFFSFQYTFRVEESEHNESECVWDNCIWTISKPSWAIEYGDPESTNGHYQSECTVYVAEQDDNYVELTAIIDNGCGRDTSKIYLKPSFLDTEESSCIVADFDILPNPNNGHMTLNFVNMTGKIDIKVYDMHGILVDNIQTYSMADSHIFTYDMKAKAQGLYLFIANGEVGSLTKKVIISP